MQLGPGPNPLPYVVLGIQSPNSQFYLFFSKFTNVFYFICEFAFHILELNIYFLWKGFITFIYSHVCETYTEPTHQTF